jgi:cobalt-zinc-cadmium efflux system outer membrane protein
MGPAAKIEFSLGRLLRITVTLSAICIVEFAGAARAQMNLSFNDAISRALQANPLIATEESKVEAAQGLKEQAGLPPNPRFIFQSENTRLGWGGQPFSYWNDTDDYFYLEQPIEIAGKRRKRIDFAAAGVGVSRMTLALLRREIAARTSLAYWNALVAVRIRDLLRENLSTFQQIVEYHRNRVREGSMPEADLLRVEVARDTLEVQAQNAAVDADRAKITLLRELGMDGRTDIVLTEPLNRIVEVAPIDVQAALERRPEVALAEQRVAQARANLTLQRANAFPDPSLVAGYKRWSGFDTILFGVQVDLPVFNRNQGRKMAAVSELSAAKSALAAVKLQVRNEIESAINDYQIRRRLVMDVPRPMLRRALETSRIAQGAYLEGGADLLRLLDAERTRIETEILYNRTLAQYRESVSALRLALGMMP